MIHVEYKKQDNFPPDREIILFDRDAFQSLGDEGLLKVNKIYNVLCPQVFVMECLAPNRASSAEKEQLLRRLELIENPIVLTGDTNISPIIDIPRGVEYSGILSSEQIARNCIMSKPITMERVASEKLISHYEPRIGDFKRYIKTITEKCDAAKGMLTPNKISSDVQKIVQPMLEMLDRTVSKQEVKKVLRQNKRTYVTQTPSYAAEKTLQEIENETMDENITMLEKILHLTNISTNRLRRELTDRKRLTVENYPHLAYPIYIYYLFKFTTYARQINAEHLDNSYWSDFRYLHYLNFCDLFITNEKSTPHIVNSIPYSNIKETRIMRSDELKSELQI